MLIKELKFFQESTAGNKICKELTYKQEAAFHPSALPSKGFQPHAWEY